jgi:hypothetical protein
MEDFIYLDSGEIKVSESAMMIPEFKDLKRYDRSTNKVWFDAVMSYIYFVYKIFGENVSYLSNTPIHQRKVQAVKNHTGKYNELSLFENDERVQAAINAYLRFSRTRSEMLFDALKEDIDRFTDYVQSIPSFIKKNISVPVKEHDGDTTIERMHTIEIEIANTKERIEAIKGAKELDELYKKTYKETQKDAKINSANIKLFESKDSIKKMAFNSSDIPKAIK